jgi:HD-like signal output (HDOD) protein
LEKSVMSEKVPTVLDLQTVTNIAGDLPALPGSAMAAMKLADDPKVNARELQAVIARDQALTARILKICNSAMFSFEREVATLSHAIAILGLDKVRSIIVAATVQQMFHADATSGKDLTTRLFWEHSWGAAMAARALAVATRFPVPEEAFTCGLLHDMGKMVLLKNRGDLYRDILNDVYRGETSFYQAEIQAFGFSHAHLGALLASKWRFPSQLVEGILCHHDIAAAPKYRHLAAITSLADRMMILLEVGFQKDKSLKLEEEVSAQYLKLTAQALQKLLAGVQAMMATLPGIAHS